MTTLIDTELDGLIAQCDFRHRHKWTPAMTQGTLDRAATALRQLREENARLREENRATQTYIEYLAEADLMSAMFLHAHNWRYPAEFLERGAILRNAIALAKPDRRVAQRRVKGDPRWSEYQDEYRSYHERRKQESTK